MLGYTWGGSECGQSLPQAGDVDGSSVGVGQVGRQ
jgi:hypothetical protein